jgi:hypothetical protein
MRQPVLTIVTRLALLVMVAGFALIPLAIPLGVGQFHGWAWGLIAFALVFAAELSIAVWATASVGGESLSRARRAALLFKQPVPIIEFGAPRSLVLVSGLLLSAGAFVPIWPLLMGSPVQGNMGVEARWLFAAIFACLGGGLAVMGLVLVLAPDVFQVNHAPDKPGEVINPVLEDRPRSLYPGNADKQ